MEPDTSHDLAAAYALDALEPHERRRHELHLETCETCRREARGLQEAAAALALGVVAPEPSPRLRKRVLGDAGRDRQASVVPLRRRRPVAGALAVVAAAAAVIAVVWGAAVSRELSRERAGRQERDRAVLVLAERDVERLPVQGAEGAVIRGTAGDAALVVRGLAPAPRGKTYQAWVVDGGRAASAGVFDATEPATVHALSRPLPGGAVVTVTLERAGGVLAPSSTPLFSSSPA